ncbi:MAG: hypothetical protein CUN54_06460 [Phototrophicales bacterium]|nr:MAG: hypothetical protein CUN54_06460 [Phototrophicales bacterium]
MASNAKPTLAFIGVGKVGTVLARLWSDNGYRVVALYNRTPQHAKTLAQYIDAPCTQSAIEAVQQADITLLTVADDTIESVANLLTQQANGDNLKGKAIIHTSGAHGKDLLNALAHHGAMTGSLHPVFPFADVATAMQYLPGATFAVETDDAILQTWLTEMVTALQGNTMVIPPGQKSLYHCALTIASNYTVTLYAIAQTLLAELGADQQAADTALNTLLNATVNNLVEHGARDALTGALVRNDVGTIQAHLEALQEQDREVLEMYKQLARLTLPLVAARGVSIDALANLLRKEDSNATNYS